MNVPESNQNSNMETIKNFRQLYCCCGCSLKIGCILIAIIEICYPIMLTCSPAAQSNTVLAINWVLYVSASIILLYGAITGKSVVLLSWIIYRGAVIFLTFAGFIYQMNEIYSTSQEKAKFIIFFLIVMIFYFAVNGYFWTVVYSHYKELTEKDRVRNGPGPSLRA